MLTFHKTKPKEQTMKKSFWIILILNLSFALGQTISGTVTDENGNGLAGANVSVEGTNMGAAANS